MRSAHGKPRVLPETSPVPDASTFPNITAGWVCWSWPCRVDSLPELRPRSTSKRSSVETADIFPTEPSPARQNRLVQELHVAKPVLDENGGVRYGILQSAEQTSGSPFPLGLAGSWGKPP